MALTLRSWVLRRRLVGAIGVSQFLAKRFDSAFYVGTSRAVRHLSQVVLVQIGGPFAVPGAAVA
jgi:hypothetical protein